ncbi:hypothetical protein E4U43_001999 [Claviceps pusilla]|uniref:Uncharacterized protein n=1 Tax=Claviceps pusilla TaxID=123648 RepID=A0A9P7N9G9_9HYPO|nr:hypothetical protein E4U43_001999 [Claviceps pusilla]
MRWETERDSPSRLCQSIFVKTTSVDQHISESGSSSAPSTAPSSPSPLESSSVRSSEAIAKADSQGRYDGNSLKGASPIYAATLFGTSPLAHGSGEGGYVSYRVTMSSMEQFATGVLGTNRALKTMARQAGANIGVQREWNLTWAMDPRNRTNVGTYDA